MKHQQQDLNPLSQYSDPISFNTEITALVIYLVLFAGLSFSLINNFIQCILIMIFLPKLLSDLHVFPPLYTTAPCLFLLSSPCQWGVPIWLAFSNLVCAPTVFVSSDIRSPDEFRRPCFFEVFCQFWLLQSLCHISFISIYPWVFKKVVHLSEGLYLYLNNVSKNISQMIKFRNLFVYWHLLKDASNFQDISTQISNWSQGRSKSAIDLCKL